ncbi:MAG: hypothetical protein HC911_17555 [Chloroflexaceae bacterium]|nr:hypothetical protein [Chloroflexaceae bacterium]
MRNERQILLDELVWRLQSDAALMTWPTVGVVWITDAQESTTRPRWLRVAITSGTDVHTVSEEVIWVAFTVIVRVGEQAAVPSAAAHAAATRVFDLLHGLNALTPLNPAVTTKDGRLWVKETTQTLFEQVRSLTTHQILANTYTIAVQKGVI